MLPDISKDRLYKTVPVVYNKKNYIVYSPFKKVFLNIKKIDKNKLKELPVDFFGPVCKRKLKKRYGHLSLITTTDCNLRCIYCFANGGDKKKYLDKETAFKSIDEVWSRNIDKLEITFFGGEPTLNFRLIKDVVNYCKKKRIKSKFDITTNGVIPWKITEYLLDKKFNITVSCDGPPNIQNKLRKSITGKSVSKIIEKNLKKLSTSPERLKVRVTITEDNVNQMEKIVKYLSKLGVKYIHFALVSISGRAKSFKNIQPSAEDYALNFIKSLDVAKNNQVSITDEALIYLLKPATNFCSSTANTKMILTPDGKISTCLEVQSCDSENKLFLIGEYNYKNKSFDYDYKKIKKLKELHVENILACKKCPWKYICSGGCPIRNLVVTNNILVPNKEYCKIKKFILHEAIVRMCKD